MNYLIIVLVLIISGVFWRLGGWRGDLKPCRAFGVPIIIVLGKLFIAGSWWIPLYILSFWAMTSLFSYGLSAPPHKFWVKVFGKGEGGNIWIVEFMTRATCGLFWGCAASLFILCGASLPLLIAYVVFLTLANGFVGASKLSATWSEFLVGASVACCVLI